MPDPDYSDWLTPERLVDIEKEWGQMDRSELIAEIMKHEPKRVVEFCCGTGWIPFGLPLDVGYLGLDSNPHCLKLAQEKNPTREFMQGDVRGFKGIKLRVPIELSVDMALAFSCLKHFTLDEYDNVYGHILSAGDMTLCSVYLADEDREDKGFDFPHTAVSREHLERVVKAHGHEIINVLVMPPLVGSKEPLVLTRRIEEEFLL